MSYFSFDNIEIAGVSAAVPAQEITVDSFKQVFGEDIVERFKSNVGVKSFRRVLKDQTASDLGYVAAEDLLKKLSFDRRNIGLLTYVSLSQDYLRPATACVLQYRLGLESSCAAFDIGMGCSGFVYGLQVTSSVMQNSDIEWALMLCCESANQLMYPKDRSTAMLIGDAGTAILLHKAEGHCIRGLLGTDGKYYQAAVVPAGGFRHRDAPSGEFKNEEGICRTNYHYLMNGLDIFSYSVSDVPKAISEFLRLSDTDINDYQALLLHQANQIIISRLIRKLGYKSGDVPVSMDRFGNTSSAAIPLTVCSAYADCKLKKKAIACGFGTGLSYGVTSFDLDTRNVFPIIETEETFDDGLIR